MKRDIIIKLVLLFIFIFFTLFVINIVFGVEIPKNESSGVLGEKTKTFLPPKVSSVKDPFNDITIKPYGCFINLKNQYFLQESNPYNKLNQLDSGIIIKDDSIGKQDLLRLIKTIHDNGYEKYANTLLKKYENKEATAMSLMEYATLGYLNGYKYISLYKTDLRGKGRVYFTYSPPTASSAIYKHGYDFNDSEYQDILTKPTLPVESLTPLIGDNSDSAKCGFPCLSENGEPITFKDSGGNTREYMCGSVNYPSIKDDELWAMYEITAN